ncbi:MAG: SDR family NAD(P)-dependent oxidoreductase, partial [Bacteroidota bacterium]
EIFTQKEIAQLCFAVAGKECKITTLPDWFRKQLLFWLRAFTSSKTYGPIEFFLTTLSIDMIAPTFGNHRLEDHLIKLRNKQKSYNLNNQ